MAKKTKPRGAPKSVAYAWDIVGCEVTKIAAHIPDGCTPKQALILFDAALADKCGGDEMASHGRRFRQVGDVFVMDARFGHDQECHLYWCPEGDASASKELAKKELDRVGEDDSILARAVDMGREMAKRKTAKQIVAEVHEHNPDGLDIGVPADYVPSDGEVDNIVYLICKYTAQWPMRSADLAICKMMAGDMKGREGIEQLVRVTCEYVWDHICGEPKKPTAKDFFTHMKPLLEEWYSKTSADDRSKTS